MPMKKYKIAVLDDYQNVALESADWSVLRDRADIAVFQDHLADPDAVVERLLPFDVVCVMRERSPLPRNVIERLPNLKLIASTGAVNASIDVAAASEHGIAVVHTGYRSDPTIEFTWALILGSARHIVTERNSVRSGGWQQTVGTDLRGKTLGVLGLSTQIRAHCLLPAAGSDGIPLRHDVSRGAQDQRPGKFDRRVRPIPRVKQCDPMLARSGDIDRRVYSSRRGNELEIGKALNDVAGQRGPLAHNANDIKRQQPLNYGVRIGKVVLKYGDVRSIAEHRPIGALKRHILVIVQDSDLVLLHWHPSRSDSFECLSGFNISLCAPFDCQEQVGGWEFFLHSINKAIRIFGFFEFFLKN